MKKISYYGKIISIVLMFLLFVNINLKAQNEILNIVPNPGFEEYYNCPQYSTQDGSAHKLVPFWTYPTAGTTDYFNSCGNAIAGVPNNFAGESPAQEGKGYIGMIVRGTRKHVREYAQAKLDESMVEGEKYCVSFHIRLASYSKFAVGEMGLYLLDRDVTSNPAWAKSWSALEFKPQVKNETQEQLTQKDKWVELCGIYTARGTEKYVVIGNFRSGIDNREINLGNGVNKRGKQYAYYYIDNVRIFHLRGNCDACGCIDNTLEVKRKTQHRTVNLIPKGGLPPYSYEWENGDTTKAVKITKQGTYSYTVYDDNGCSFKEEFDFIPPPVTLTVTHKAEYTGGNDGWIDVIPTGGKKPYKYKWNIGKTTEDLSNLWEGKYIYTVTDANGDEVTGTVIFKDKFRQELEKVEEGGKITLKNIFFDFDKTELLPKSFIELDKLYQFMQENNIKKVEISGHTDSKGNDEYNQKLSEARAKSVVDYLTRRGIEKERLISAGYGEAEPIDTNSTDAGRANNRRVEFKILKK